MKQIKKVAQIFFQRLQDYIEKIQMQSKLLPTSIVRCCSILGTVVFSCSTQHKLKLPIAYSHFVTQVKTAGIHTDTDLFLLADKYFRVVSAEEAVVQSVVSVDSNLYIILRGKYKITYGGLKEVYVKKGDRIKRG